MAQSIEENKVLCGMNKVCYVTDYDTVTIYDYQTGKTETITHSFMEKAVYFQGILYTLNSFYIEDFNYVHHDGYNELDSINYSVQSEKDSRERFRIAYRDEERVVEMNMVYRWENGVAKNFFYGQKLTLSHTRDSLYIGDFTSDGINIYKVGNSVDFEFPIATFIDGISGKQISIDDTCNNLYILCDTVIYTIIDNDICGVRRLYKFSHVEHFFYRKGIVYTDSNIRHISSCGRFFVYFKNGVTSVTNSETGKRKTFGQLLYPDKDMLYDIETFERRTIKNELLYLLPGVDSPVLDSPVLDSPVLDSPIGKYIKSEYHDNNLEKIISEYL
jgi:hypothetical protein